MPAGRGDVQARLAALVRHLEQAGGAREQQAHHTHVAAQGGQVQRGVALGKSGNGEQVSK